MITNYKFDTLFDELFSNFESAYSTAYEKYTAHTKLEDDVYNFQLALPGYSKEDVSVDIENGILVIESKQETESEWVKSFTKKYRMPKDIDVEAIEAKLENGLLSVKLPKLEQARKKAISIA